MSPSTSNTDRQCPIAKNNGETKKIIIYLDERAARGCGHVGIIFVYADDRAERIYQSAKNPDDAIFRLLLFKQPVRVILKKTARFRYLRQLTASKTFFQLKTTHGAEIRHAVDRYISDNAPYNSLVNNCCHFIHYILQAAPDVKKKIRIIPKHYYKSLKKMCIQKN